MNIVKDASGDVRAWQLVLVLDEEVDDDGDADDDVDEELLQLSPDRRR